MELEKTFAVACKEFFGVKEGQSLFEFAAEVKQLSPEDRAEIKQLLEAQGHKIRE